MYKFILLALGGVGLYLMRKKKAADKLIYEPQGIKTDGKFPKYKFTFLLDVVNPTDTDIDINAIFADITINDKNLGRIERQEAIKINPLKTTRLLLPIKISLTNAFNIANIILSIIFGKKNIKAKIVGTITAQGFQSELLKEVEISV